MNVLKIISVLRIQILLLLFLFLFTVLSAWEVIPSTSELSKALQVFFDSYGLPSIGAISFFENIVGMNAFFPGSVVILIAMAMTAGDLQKAFLTFLFIYIPAVIAHNINYMLGRFGYIEPTSTIETNFNSKRKKDILYLYVFTFWHPHFTALSCLASGAEGMEYKKFIFWFLVISLPWNIFWAALMYSIGMSTGSEFNFMPFMIAYVLVWGGYDYMKYRNNKRNMIK